MAAQKGSRSPSILLPGRKAAAIRTRGFATPARGLEAVLTHPFPVRLEVPLLERIFFPPLHGTPVHRAGTRLLESPEEAALTLRRSSHVPV